MAATPSPEKAFWDWFVSNAGRIANGARIDQRSITEDLNKAIRKVHPSLVWEISRAKDGPWKFCVSADHQRALFGAVERLVGEAPKIPGWEIQALRQRGPLTPEINLGGSRLRPEDVWCTSEPAPAGGLKLTLWIRGLTPANETTLSSAAVILLDNAIGERDVVTKIAELHRGVLPADPASDPKMFPISRLAGVVDALPK